jgi:hypothetical protein
LGKPFLAGPGTCGKPVDGAVPFENCGGTDGRGIGTGVDIDSAIGGATGGGGGVGGSGKVDTDDAVEEAEGIASAENTGGKLLLAAIISKIIVYHLMISYNL